MDFIKFYTPMYKIQIARVSARTHINRREIHYRLL